MCEQNSFQTVSRDNRELEERDSNVSAISADIDNDNKTKRVGNFNCHILRNKQTIYISEGCVPASSSKQLISWRNGSVGNVYLSYLLSVAREHC